MSVELYKNGSLIKTPIIIRWSGNKDTVSRTLEFEYISGDACETGDKIIFIEDGKILFVGQVYYIDFSSDGKNISVKCFDAIYNMVKSDATGRFNGTLADISTQICKIFGLNSQIKGNKAQIEVITTGDLTYYDIIHKASKIDFEDKKFNIRMSGTNSLVLESQLDEPVYTLSSSVNIREAEYSESIENMINTISIVTSDGVVLETRDNSQDIAKYGIFQNIERQREDDNKTELELKSVEYGGDLLVDGNTILTTGKKVTIKEPLTGIIGDFFITSDTHTWVDGDYNTQLGIDYVK